MGINASSSLTPIQISAWRAARLPGKRVIQSSCCPVMIFSLPRLPPRTHSRSLSASWGFLGPPRQRERAGALRSATALAVFPPRLCTVSGEKHIMLCAVGQCWVTPLGDWAVGMKPKINFSSLCKKYTASSSSTLMRGRWLPNYGPAASRHRATLCKHGITFSYKAQYGFYANETNPHRGLHKSIPQYSSFFKILRLLPLSSSSATPSCTMLGDRHCTLASMKAEKVSSPEWHFHLFQDLKVFYGQLCSDLPRYRNWSEAS